MEEAVGRLLGPLSRTWLQGNKDKGGAASMGEAVHIRTYIMRCLSVNLSVLNLLFTWYEMLNRERLGIHSHVTPLWLPTLLLFFCYGRASLSASPPASPPASVGTTEPSAD